MSQNGLLTDVRWEWTGTEVTADLLTGETVLPVLDPLSITAGEFVWVASSGPYEITGTDPDAATFTITPGLSLDVDGGTEVARDIGGKPGQVWVAEVILPDAAKPIEVPLTIHDLSVMPEGTYDPPVAIILSDDLQRVENLPGSLPIISGEYIPSDSLPPADVLPPSASPVPEVFSGSGAAVVRWDHVEGATHYTLHRIAATDSIDTPPVDPPSVATIYAENASSPMFVADVPIDTTTFFAVQAHGAVSSEDPEPSAWVPGRAGPINETIMAASVALVNQLISELVETNGLNIGTGSWTDEAGILIPGVMGIPVDGSLGAWVKAALTADSLTVNNFFKLLGLINSIAQGSQLVLDNSVEDPPQTKPVLANAWPQVSSLTDPDFTQLCVQAATGGGGSVDDHVTLWPGTIITSGAIYRFKDNVMQPGYLQFPEGPDYAWTFQPVSVKYHSGELLDDGGQPGDPGYFYVIGRRNFDTIQNSGDWWMYRVALAADGTFSIAGDYRIGGPTYFTHQPHMCGNPGDWNTFSVIGWKSDGTLAIYVADVGNDATGLYGRQTLTGYNTPFDIIGTSGADYTWPGEPASGPADPELIMLWRATGDPIVFNWNTLARDSSRVPKRAYGKTLKGADRLWSLDTDGKIYSYVHNQYTGDIAYTWANHGAGEVGVRETALSQSVATTPISRGASIGFTIPTVPDSGDPNGPNRARIYGRTGANPFRLQGYMTQAQVSSYLEWIREDLAAHGGLPNFAAAGLQPARFKSAFSDITGPLIDLWGSGTWRLGDMKSEGVAGRFEFLKKTTLTASGTYTRSIELMRIGQMVFAFGDLDRASGFNASFHSTGLTMPVGFRPVSNVLTGHRPNSGATASYRYRFNADGTIDIQETAAIGIFMEASAQWITEDA